MKPPEFKTTHSIGFSSVAKGIALRILDLSGFEAIVGPPTALWAQKKQKQWRNQHLGLTLETLAARCGDQLTDAEDQPLFIFSAGWRSGSTLLQRLINSNETYLIWGEPYARSELIVRLADSLRPISLSWPPDGDLAQPTVEWDPTDRWTANLHPPLVSLIESHRAFFRTLFASPLDATRSGNWGFKEVRLSAEYALYLRFLFPKAKFIFLVRNPVNAFVSYKVWRSWYRRWPDKQVRTARSYARVWRELAVSFWQMHDAVDGLLLRYEDLIPRSPAISSLEAFLDSPVDQSVLERRIGGSTSQSQPLTRFERFALQSQLGGVERRFGYSNGCSEPGSRWQQRTPHL
jgi:Sulfotransferase domain.